MANIFDKDNAALMSFGKVMSRMAAQPLDISEVWYDKAELETYAASDATAYAGQKVTYVDKTNSKVYQYSIQVDGTLAEIGSSVIGDEKTIHVNEDGTVKLYGVEGLSFTDEEGAAVNYQPLLVDGVLTWVVPSATTVEGLASEIEGIKTRLSTVETGLTNVYTKEEADGKFITEQYNDEALVGRVETLENAGYQTANDVATTLASYATTESVNTALADKADKSAYEQTVTDLDNLEAKVDAFLTGTGTEAALDSLQELIEYINTHDDVEISTIIADIETLEGKLEGIDTTVVAYVTAAIDALKIGDYAKASDLTALAERVTTLEAKPFDTYATKQEITDAGYATAADVANTYATKQEITDAGYAVAADVYTKDEVYTKSETDAAITAKINSVTGGESAADVKLALEDYRDAVNVEIWGTTAEGWTQTITDEDGKTVVTYTPQYGTTSRIDTLETTVASNTTLAQKGVDDAAAAKTAADAAQATADQNKTALGTLQTNFDTIVTKAETGLVAKVAALENADTAIGARVTALESKDTSIEQTLGEHTNKISALESKDTDLAALIQGNTNKFANYYTKTEADAAVQKVTGEVATDTTLVAMIGAKANSADVYTKEQINGLLANLDQSELEASIQANTDAIAALAGEGNTSTVAKNAADIATLDATLKAALENNAEGLDSIKELALWIEEHETEVLPVINAHDAILAGIGGTDEPATVVAYVEAAIADAAYDLPAATAADLGGIKSAADVDNKAVLNAVYVDASTHIASVKAVSTDILENGTEELILFGGNSGATAE